MRIIQCISVVLRFSLLAIALVCIMLSTETTNETTTLVEKDSNSTSQLFCKKESFARKCCLLIYAVVCGLAIVFAVLMTKWYFISQSVITPTISQAEALSRQDFDADDLSGRDGSHQAEKPDSNHDNRDHDRYAYDGDDSDDASRGATAKQLGKAFPLTILAQIAWKDLSNMLTFGGGSEDSMQHLAQSVSMMPVYINEQDCGYAVNYFENKAILGENKDCQYVDFNDFDFVFGKNECEEEDNDHDESGSEMFRITNRIMDYFYENYATYLMDCEISDIEMIKYVSNGTRYSGLHAETHHIDGQRIIINYNKDDDDTDDDDEIQVDYVGIVFLNDNFDGGNLQFISPKSIDIISPQIGNAVLFGGGLDYSHRVTPVTNGNRYVLKMIFNKY